ERKLVETALRESETRLRDALHRAKLAYWSWDPATQTYAFGEGYSDVVGVVAAEVATDEAFLRFVHEADRNQVAAALRRQREAPGRGIADHRLRHSDGRVIWLRETCEQERDADGQARRLVGTVQDITDQKRAEAALRESEARLHRAGRMAKFGHWKWTANGPHDGGTGRCGTDS